MHIGRSLQVGSLDFLLTLCIVFDHSRAPGCYLDTKTLKNYLPVHPKIFVKNFQKCQFQTYY